MNKKQIYAILKELDRSQLLTCSPLSILKNQGDDLLKTVETANTLQIRCSYCSNSADECVEWDACKYAPYREG